MERVALVAVAGSLGALSRYGLQAWINGILGPTVLSTFVVNVSGAFLLGLLVGVAEGRVGLPANTRLVLGVGFLGAYTTFSTLMYESANRIEGGAYLTASINLIGSIIIGMVAVFAGLVLGRNLSGL